MGLKRPSRKEWDEALPTLLRYLGAVLIVFYAVGSSFGLKIPESVLIAATGLILYKNVAGGGSDSKGNGGKNGSP